MLVYWRHDRNCCTYSDPKQIVAKAWTFGFCTHCANQPRPQAQGPCERSLRSATGANSFCILTKWIFKHVHKSVDLILFIHLGPVVQTTISLNLG